MKCGDCRNLLSRFLDQALTDLERGQVTAHLDSCPDCRRLHQSFVDIHDTLGALPAAEPPDGLSARVTSAALRAGREPGRSFLDRLIPIAWPTAALAVAVALLLMVLQPRLVRSPSPASTKATAAAAASEDPVGAVASLPSELADPRLAVLGEP